jgi:hypothetical protein
VLKDVTDVNDVLSPATTKDHDTPLGVSEGSSYFIQASIVSIEFWMRLGIYLCIHPSIYLLFHLSIYLYNSGSISLSINLSIYRYV